VVANETDLGDTEVFRTVKLGRSFYCMLSLLAAGLPLRAQAADATALEFFEKEVRPVLAEHCISCHGPEKQKGELRLDHGSFIAHGGETGPVISADNPESSRLLVAVSYHDVDFQMPPKGKLPEEQIEALRAWISQGAPWPDEPVPSEGAPGKPAAFELESRRDNHWAWQPVQDPAPPQVKDAAWPRSDIDKFILSRLELEGFAPAPEADRRTLARRVYFDLTGLPPAPEAVEAFVADTRPDAYEQLVDSLLASPAFGERWGRHWLDITRYAETYGHEQDYPVDYAWRYRDYVIRALNADVPYDQMVREHIAGDLLPEPRIDPATGMNESVAATGFWYMHQATHAPVDVRIDQADRIDNQIDVFSKAFLGLTVSCARCHDHKFDAISMKDYYGLAGFLRSSRQQHAYVDPHGKVAEGVERLERSATRVARAITEGFESATDLATPVSPWMLAAAEVKRSGRTVEEVATERTLDAGRLGRWVETLNDAVTSEAGNPLELWAKVAQLPAWSQGFVLAGMATQARQPAAVAALPAGDVLFETFDSPDAFQRWTAYGDAFGHAPTGNNAWCEERGRVELVPAGVAHSGLVDTKLEGTLRSADFTLEHESLQYLAAGTRGGELRLIIEGYELREFNGLLFESTFVPVKHGEEFRWLHQVGGLGKFKGRTAYIEIVDPGEGWVAVDEIRFSDAAPQPAPDTATMQALFAGDAPASLEMLAARYDGLVREAVSAWPQGNATAAQMRLLNALQRGKLWSPLDGNERFARAVETKDKQADELPRYERVLAMADGTPQDERVMLRGSYKTPADLVPRRFLEGVGGDEHPPVEQGSGRMALADRVLGEENPFTSRVMVNRIWHHLMGRGIVASVDNFGVLGQPPSHPELLDYLATRFREQGWSIKGAIRNVVLSQTYRMSSVPSNPVAEEKDPDNLLLHRMNRRRLEGEVVRDAILAVAGTLDATQFGPSVPAYISPFLEGNRRPEVSGPEDGARRRSIYMEVRRNYLPPMLQAFDMPVPDSTQGRRNVSNVPAQALILMNDPVVTQQAEAWAKQLLRDADSPEARIRSMFLRALAREPEPAELARMVAYIGEQAPLYGLDPAAAANDERIWADLCHVVYMLKEFIFIG
jgi:mono/diheme cytochrome c family protein